jgi:2-methylcitrate dehydratase PrpD
VVNGYLITAATICDAHLPTQCHVTPEVLPPTMAVAEARPVSGDRFLAALAAGLEVTTRVGLGLKPPVMQSRAWHAPGITGPFGGAAAVGNLLDLSVEQQQYAFGLAGSEAAGTMAQWGTIAVKFHQARGSADGLLAGTLAGHGFTSAPDILTKPVGGLLVNYSDGGDPEAIVAGLGERWELMNISLRPWPVAALMQSVAAATLGVREQIADPASVARIRVSLPDKAFGMHGAIEWPDSFSARLSTRYIAAVVMLDGVCALDQFSDARLVADDVNTLARNGVTVDNDSSAPDGSAAVEVTTADGGVVRYVSASPPGHPASPLPRERVMAKFQQAVAGRSLAAKSEVLAETLPHMAEQPDAGAVLAALRAHAGTDAQR